MHQAIGNTLRVLTTIELPQGAAEVEQLVDTAIADAVYAARCSYHSALKSTPGSVAFGQDMILNIPIITDLQQLQKRRQELVNKRLIEANAKRFAYDYAVWERVLRLVYHTDKLDPSAVGPYTITQVHAIGTLTIEFLLASLSEASYDTSSHIVAERGFSLFTRFPYFSCFSSTRFFLFQGDVALSSRPDHRYLERQSVVSQDRTGLSHRHRHRHQSHDSCDPRPPDVRV
jgi:hypothetical protein